MISLVGNGLSLYSLALNQQALERVVFKLVCVPTKSRQDPLFFKTEKSRVQRWKNTNACIFPVKTVQEESQGQKI